MLLITEIIWLTSRHFSFWPKLVILIVQLLIDDLCRILTSSRNSTPLVVSLVWMIPKSPDRKWKMIYGVLYCVVYSNDVHFNLLCDFFFFFFCLSGNAASTPQFSSRHLHSHLWPLNSVTAVWGSHFIPWLSGEIRQMAILYDYSLVKSLLN